MANSEALQTSKTWLITGASRGFGLELTEYLLQAGHKVVATARKPEGHLTALVEPYKEQALVLALDVTKPEQVEAAVAAATKHFGQIDVLVNNAGFGMVGAIEESHEDEYRPMFEANVFGLIRMTQAVLPQMRERKSGHIVNLSSIGGLVATPGFGMYNGTKFAVEGISEALAAEVKPLGIKVTIVEPGPFRTDFLARQDMPAANHIVDYDQTAGKMREYAEKQNGIQPGDPKRGVAAMVKAIESEHPPLHLLLGASTIPRLQGKIDALLKELETWRAETVGADFPEGE